ncbi:MAG: hypothetical protein ACYDG2_11920 [Ruminiclostridium sp.]
MGRSLDIDMYKDGFSIKSVDCIHGPIAAAAGYYTYDFYFYYNFLHCIYVQTSIIYELNLNTYATKILENMGLSLEIIDCTNISDKEAISNISDIIIDGIPVILVTKYNALFYNAFYKNTSFKLTHAIIINEYLDGNRVFGIKESTLLRDYIETYKNTDLFFLLHITDIMLYDIWMIANEQFSAEHSFFYKKFFAVKKNTQKIVNINMVIRQAENILNDWDNMLIDTIDNYDKEGYFDYSTYDIDWLLEYQRQRYCGSLKPIYNLLYSCCGDDSDKYQKVSKVEEKQTSARKRVLDILQMAILKNQTLSKDKRQELKSIVMDTDNEMIHLIKSFVVNYVQQKIDYYYIDISSMYNNQAFASCISNDSVATITHNGIHFIIDDNIYYDIVWNQGNFSFLYPYKPEQCDNIACDGQVIIINNLEVSEISFLACAEYGDFQVPIQIEYENEEKIDIQAYFSDFYQPSKYGEKVFWSGVAARRNNGVTVQSASSARLLAKTYKFDKNIVKKIVLPVCKNVHIFAITLINDQNN